VCADLRALPFAGQAFDLAWSNLALQWVNDLPGVLAELRRCLRVGGLLTFTTFGPDTLKELRGAFAVADAHPHVSRFVDMHDIGDMLVAAGFSAPVMDMEMLTIAYPAADGLLRDLRASGQTSARADRPRGLTGKGFGARLRGAVAANATFEVVYGHAWKRAPVTETAKTVRVFKRMP
jgi:malonyl-CoA O-methyltransferase